MVLPSLEVETSSVVEAPVEVEVVLPSSWLVEEVVVVLVTPSLAVVLVVMDVEWFLLEVLLS